MSLVETALHFGINAISIPAPPVVGTMKYPIEAAAQSCNYQNSIYVAIHNNSGQFEAENQCKSYGNQ